MIYSIFSIQPHIHTYIHPSLLFPSPTPFLPSLKPSWHTAGSSVVVVSSSSSSSSSFRSSPSFPFLVCIFSTLSHSPLSFSFLVGWRFFPSHFTALFSFFLLSICRLFFRLFFQLLFLAFFCFTPSGCVVFAPLSPFPCISIHPSIYLYLSNLTMTPKHPRDTIFLILLIFIPLNSYLHPPPLPPPPKTLSSPRLLPPSHLTLSFTPSFTLFTFPLSLSFASLLSWLLINNFILSLKRSCFPRM